jgi:large subunit ribosomal protein L25
MQGTVLKAMPRSESPKAVRNAGLIPGVLNESDTSSVSVKFEAAALNKIIAQHGANAKIWVQMGTDKKFGFIKEVQKHPVDRNVIHIAIQMVSKDQDVKMQLPIAFHGRDDLEHKSLQLQIYKSEIEVVGKALLMPDVVIVDVSKKELGETVTAADFKLPKGIKTLDSEHEVYAIIKAVKEEIVEEPKEVTPVAP